MYWRGMGKKTECVYAAVLKKVDENFCTLNGLKSLDTTEQNFEGPKKWRIRCENKWNPGSIANSKNYQ